MFIGDSEWIGKGLGSKSIKTFIDTYVCPEFKYCIVDPDVKNRVAIRCYKKLKFKEHAIIDSVDALQRPTKLKLMLLKCNGS
ncbi:MAG: hypothetical protein A3F46_10210 [Legionellales bacterium RIFCSPHIGHO2_12_FULL_42_9]|nr:MAG: hypothetical protein A3F46_10210 [Legionellales bacterium RIFCSPHIGHO2_12_FULL_42_9]